MSIRKFLWSGGAVAAAALAGSAVAQPAPAAAPPTAAAPASAAPAAPAPKPGDHVIAVTNSGGVVVSAVYVAPTGSLDFSDDLLGKQVASVGKTVRLKVKDPTGGCVFDLQFLLADGTSVTRKGVNVCQTESFTFSR